MFLKETYDKRLHTLGYVALGQLYSVTIAPDLAATITSRTLASNLY